MGAGSSTIDEFVEQRARVSDAVEAVGRSPKGFRIAKRVYLALADAQNRAEKRLRVWFARYYGNPELANRVSVWGPSHRLLEALDQIVEAGAEHVLLNPVFDYAMHQQELSRLLIKSD